jgi:hypothetical protein
VDAVVVELVGVLIEPSDTPGELLRVGLIRHVGILADHAGRCPFRANDRSGPRTQRHLASASGEIQGASALTSATVRSPG